MDPAAISNRRPLDSRRCRAVARLGLLLVAALISPGCHSGDAGDAATRDANQDRSASTEADTLELVDLDNQAVDPFESPGAKAVVFLFVCTDCPISNRYAPEIQRLAAEFSPRGVAFWLVYPNADDTTEMIQSHLTEYGYTCSALRDPRHALVKRSKASITPEAAVFSPDGKLLYHGRIDNRYVDFGKLRAAPTEHDLEDVLKATLEGRPVARATAQAIGCPIPELP